MSLKTLEDAFVDELKDLLSAEKQILKALPKMAKKASHHELKEAFDEHCRETEEQVRRLERVFESLGRSARSKKCEGMEGIIEEAKELMGEKAEPEVMDAVLIASAQKVEHYEIASYGTACTWGKLLGHDGAVELLKQNIAEEKAADEKLTALAEQMINVEATAPAGG